MILRVIARVMPAVLLGDRQKITTEPTAADNKAAQQLQDVGSLGSVSRAFFYIKFEAISTRKYRGAVYMQGGLEKKDLARRLGVISQSSLAWRC